MKNTSPAAVLLLLCLLAAFPVQAAPSRPDAPFVTWGAMLRLWNKMALPGVTLANEQPTRQGYVVVIAPAVVLEATMQGERVKKLRLQFDSQNDTGGGGPLFLRGVATAIRVGGYTWPQAQRDEATSLFAAINPGATTYEYDTTRLSRQAFVNGSWEFIMEYLLAALPVQ